MGQTQIVAHVNHLPYDARTAMPSFRLSPRDIDILQALDRGPLTAQQLCKLSDTFALPFTHERRVRERMQVLHRARLIHRGSYATSGAGSPAYFRLARAGFEVLHGPDARTPTKRYFSPVSLGRQYHTHALAEFIVRTCVSTADLGIQLDGFCRENTVRLRVGEESLFPDCAFQLVGAAGRPFGFFIELDNSTERIQSPKGCDSWERKVRLYDQVQDHSATRFRVLVVTTRSAHRLRHILSAAASIQRNPGRALFYGISLSAFLAESDPLRSPCFLDHHLAAVSLLPPGFFRDAATEHAPPTVAGRTLAC